MKPIPVERAWKIVWKTVVRFCRRPLGHSVKCVRNSVLISAFLPLLSFIWCADKWNRYWMSFEITRIQLVKNLNALVAFKYILEQFEERWSKIHCCGGAAVPLLDNAQKTVFKMASTLHTHIQTIELYLLKLSAGFPDKKQLKNLWRLRKNL